MNLSIYSRRKLITTLTDTNGILLLKKPAGITSFKALGTIKKKLKDAAGSKVKVGHTGTLDKFAEGLLVVLTGKFTRMNPLFTGFDKVYEAEICFGSRTATLDPEGEIIEQADIPDLSVIERHIPDFRGEIMQSPPIYSAVHVDGERAYKKALKGTIEKLPPRPVTIHSFEITGWQAPVLRCRIHCSKGTYIRSLARDLGEACGSCAYLTGLKRTDVGPFSLSDAAEAENFDADRNLIRGRDIFRSIDGFAPGLYRLADVNEQSIPKLQNGVAPDDSFFIDAPAEDGDYALFAGDRFLACASRRGGRYSYIFVAA